MTGPSNRQLGLQLLLCLLLVGCGFQLKGSGTGPANSLEGRSIAIISAQPRAELSAAVVQQLGLEGATIVEPEPSTLVLKLGAERFEQRNLSLTAQARSAEVELTLSTSFDLLRGRQVLVDRTEAQVVRQFLNDPRNVVGKTEELRLLREEMRHDLAAQITRRISHSLRN
jgi:LPS-assembly lipoprotein